jgi:hypothetical protein
MSHQLQNSTKCMSHTAVASHNALYSKLNLTTGYPFCWTTLHECIDYTPWRRPFKGWNVLELHTVLIKWWFNNIWVRLSVSDIINSTFRHRVVCMRVVWYSEWTGITSKIALISCPLWYWRNALRYALYFHILCTLTLYCKGSYIVERSMYEESWGPRL